MPKRTPLFLSCQSGESGIYRIRNLVNDKVYIGSTTEMGFCERLKDHLRSLRRNAHGNSHLQHAWNHYGEDAFIFEILEPITDKTLIQEREQFHIDSVSPEQRYNIAPAAPGRPLSNETKAKISARVSATLKGHFVSDETKRRLSESHLGKKKSPEVSKKTADALRGRTVSEEQRQKISNTLKGRKRPPEMVQRVAAKLRGRKRSPELVEKTASKLRGRKRSPEAIAAISKAHKGRKKTPEEIAKQKASLAITLARKRKQKEDQCE
jgi:group I intron endonuclease